MNQFNEEPIRLDELDSLRRLLETIEFHTAAIVTTVSKCKSKIVAWETVMKSKKLTRETTQKEELASLPSSKKAELIGKKQDDSTPLTTLPVIPARTGGFCVASSARQPLFELPPKNSISKTCIPQLREAMAKYANWTKEDLLKDPDVRYIVNQFMTLHVALLPRGDLLPQTIPLLKDLHFHSAGFGTDVQRRRLFLGKILNPKSDLPFIEPVPSLHSIVGIEQLDARPAAKEKVSFALCHFEQIQGIFQVPLKVIVVLFSDPLKQWISAL